MASGDFYQNIENTFCGFRIPMSSLTVTYPPYQPPLLDVKAKKLTPTAKLPYKSREEDEGFDIFADCDICIPAGQSMNVSTGIALDIRSNHYCIVSNRSSMGGKGLFRLGGVIDKGYRGEIFVMLATLRTHTIKKGDKIAQLLFFERTRTDGQLQLEELVGDFSSSERGADGFGSTDK